MWNKLLSSICFILFLCSEQVAMQDVVTEEFEKILNLPVIHATRIFPKDGKMIAGKSAHRDYEELGIQKGDPLEGTLLSAMGWRPTIHWAISKLANDIDKNTLSDRPYAIITTLRGLVSQLIGVSIEDTFILGNFEIPDGSFIIMKEGFKKDTSEETWLQRMTTLDFPSEGMILEKVTEVINNNFPDSGKINIKKGNSLKKFSESMPCVFFGKHSCHQTQVLEKIIPYLALKYYGENPTAIIKDICIQSEKLKIEVMNAYRKDLIESKRGNVARIFIQQTLKLSSSINNLSNVDKTSNEIYSYFIGDNSNTNMNSHCESFAQWSIKGKYLSDPNYLIRLSPVMVNNKVITKKDMVLKNLNLWYS